MTTISFAGIPFGGDWNVRRDWESRTTLYSSNNKPVEVGNGPYVRFTAPRTAPDCFGEENYAGVLSAHVAKYGTATPFDSECPQDLGTLPVSLNLFSGKADAGVSRIAVRHGGSIPLASGLKVGRWISIGSNKRLFLVEDITGSTLHLDIPLPFGVVDGTQVNLTPTGSWYWVDRMADDRRGFTDGVWWSGFIDAREST